MPWLSPNGIPMPIGYAVPMQQQRSRSRRRSQRRSHTRDVSELRQQYNQYNSLTSMSSESTRDCRRVRRIAVGKALAIHGVIFQLDDGTRLGKFVDDKGNNMNLYLDDSKLRKTTWTDLRDGESIEEVEFIATKEKKFLAHSILFRTTLRDLRFDARGHLATNIFGSFKPVNGRPIVEVRFRNGRIHSILTDMEYRPEGASPKALDDESKALFAPSKKIKDQTPLPLFQPSLVPQELPRPQAPWRTRSRSPNASSKVCANSIIAPRSPALAENQSTDAHLRSLSLEELQLSAFKIGATADEVDKAVEHQKKYTHCEALIALIHYKQQEKELRSLQGAELQRKAITLGVAQEELDSALNADPKKTTSKTIKLILSKDHHLYSRKCPGKCGLVATWHETHCCNRCLKGDGHGNKCDRRKNFIEALLDSPCIETPAEVARTHAQCEPSAKERTVATDCFEDNLEFSLHNVRRLEVLLNSNGYKSNDSEKKWPKCSLCPSKEFGVLHIGGKVHQQKIQWLIRNGEQASQDFHLSCGLRTFNHLTGEFVDSQDRAPESRDRSRRPLKLIPSSSYKEAEKTYEHMQKDLGKMSKDGSQKGAWTEWIGESIETLEEVLDWRNATNHHLGGFKKSDWFTCLICRRHGGLIYTHLCGKRHLGELKRWQSKHNWPSLEVAGGLTDKPWVQAFVLKNGRYLFNHFTGEQDEDVTGSQGNVQAMNEVSSVCSREPAPPPAVKLAFLRRLRNVDQEVVPFDAFQRRDYCAEQETRAGITKPTYYDLIDDGTAYSSNGVEIDWRCKKYQDRDRPVFKLRKVGLEGNCFLVLGLIREESDQFDSELRVNGARHAICFKERQIFCEHIVELKVDQNVIEIEGRLLKLLSYMHVWLKDSPGSEQIAKQLSKQKQKATPPHAEPPAFSCDARGCPKDWNRPDNVPKDDEKSALIWNKTAKEVFTTRYGKEMCNNAHADINSILEFLLQRSMHTKIGPPVRQDKGWFSMAWLEYDGKADECQGWDRAWHGCKLEALYSIMFNGKLFSSGDKSRGERTLGGTAGVYVHKEGTSHKAENYVRFVPLCDDAVFWAAKWEVKVNRKLKIKPPCSTDQWIFAEDGVQLVALWVCGRTAASMRDGDSVAREWDAEFEACPWKHPHSQHLNDAEHRSRKRA